MLPVSSATGQLLYGCVSLHSMHAHWPFNLDTQAIGLEGELSQEDRIDAPGSKVALGRKGAHFHTFPGQQQTPHSIGHLSLSQSFFFIP